MRLQVAIASQGSRQPPSYSKQNDEVERHSMPDGYRPLKAPPVLIENLVNTATDYTEAASTSAFFDVAGCQEVPREQRSEGLGRSVYQVHASIVDALTLVTFFEQGKDHGSPTVPEVMYECSQLRDAMVQLRAHDYRALLE